MSEKVLPNMWREVTMFFPVAERASIVLLMAAMPDENATTLLALVSAFTLSSRYITVGFITLE